MYGHLNTGMRTSIELCVSVLALILGYRLRIEGLSAVQELFRVESDSERLFRICRRSSLRIILVWVGFIANFWMDMGLFSPTEKECIL